MKKYSLLVLLFMVASVAAANAQCYSLDYRDLDIEDFLVDADTEEDTTSTASTVNGGGRQVAQGQQVSAAFIKRQESMNKIQSQRVAFFTREMKLTPEEAQVFWPLYNQYTEKKNMLLEEQKKMMRSFTADHITAITKSEAERIANAFAGLQQQENDLIQEYHKKFTSQLPAGKVLLMYKAEKDFMQSLLQHLQGQQQRGPKK